MVKRIQGLELLLDSAKCIGCGDCVEACVYNARIIIDGKSALDSVLCLGCGRCVDACPEGAISIEIVDPKLIDVFVSKIESIVDVEKQEI